MVKSYEVASEGYDDIEKSKFVDVDAKIRDFMREMILSAINDGRVINWNDFLNYCKHYGMENPPNILTVPISVIERCFKEVKEEFDSG